MKNFIFILLLFPFSVFALPSDYTCVTRWGVRAEIDFDGTSTHVWLYDDRWSLIFQDYTKWEEKVGEKVNYHFYPGNAPRTILTFKAADVAARAERFKGWIDSRSAMGPSIWDELNCRKN